MAKKTHNIVSILVKRLVCSYYAFPFYDAPLHFSLLLYADEEAGPCKHGGAHGSVSRMYLFTYFYFIFFTLPQSLSLSYFTPSLSLHIGNVTRVRVHDSWRAVTKFSPLYKVRGGLCKLGKPARRSRSRFSWLGSVDQLYQRTRPAGNFTEIAG